MDVFYRERRRGVEVGCARVHLFSLVQNSRYCKGKNYFDNIIKCWSHWYLVKERAATEAVGEVFCICAAIVDGSSSSYFPFTAFSVVPCRILCATIASTSVVRPGCHRSHSLQIGDPEDCNFSVISFFFSII